MPQLDFSTFASQIFWLAVTFGLLYFTLARHSLPRVREVLQSRQERIRSDLDKADESKRHAEAIEREYNEALKKARHDASEQINIAKEKHKDLAEARHAKLDEMFARQNRETELRVQKMRDDASEELSETVHDLVSVITKKLIGVDISKADAQKAHAQNIRKAS